MAANVQVCSLDPELKERLRAFRFRKEKTSQALIMKIDMTNRILQLEEVLDDVTTDELREELPEHQPRLGKIHCATRAKKRNVNRNDVFPSQIRDVFV